MWAKKFIVMQTGSFSLVNVPSLELVHVKAVFACGKSLVQKKGGVSGEWENPQTGGLRSPGVLTNSSWDELSSHYSTILCSFFFFRFSSPLETPGFSPRKPQMPPPTAAPQSRMANSFKTSCVRSAKGSLSGGKWFQSPWKLYMFNHHGN